MSLNLGKIYRDICRGYSQVKLPASKYYKHPSSVDIGYAEEYEGEMIEHYKKLGALSSDELLKKKMSEGLWSQDNENKLNFLIKNISLMTAKKRKAAVLTQLNDIEELIEGYQKEYSELVFQKHRLLHLSAEQMASSAKIEFIVHQSFFNDEECRHNSFTLDDVASFDTDELNAILQQYKIVSEEINQTNVRKISVKSYVREAIKLSAGIEHFFGKKGFELSIVQGHLFDYSNYFVKLLERIENISPEDREDPDEIERLFILEMNKDSIKQGADRTKLQQAFTKARESNS